MKFASESWPFVLPFVALAVLLAVFGHPRWAIFAAVFALAVLLFFRDPKRSFSGENGLVIAPADGLITRVDTIEDPALGPGRWNRIVTFLSVFDVHVQKAAAEGKVVTSLYVPGRKVAAYREDAGEVNEKHLTVIQRANGDKIGIRQIAGLFARRVVCYLKEGDEVRRGQPMGLIKFGSRVDLLVPESYTVLVQKGQRLKNGETPVATPGALPTAKPGGAP